MALSSLHLLFLRGHLSPPSPHCDSQTVPSCLLCHPSRDRDVAAEVTQRVGLVSPQNSAAIPRQGSRMPGITWNNEFLFCSNSCFRADIFARVQVLSEKQISPVLLTWLPTGAVSGATSHKPQRTT